MRGSEEKEGPGLGSAACLRGTSAQFLRSGNDGNSLQTGGLSLSAATAARIWPLENGKAYGCCTVLELKSSVQGLC